MRGYYIGSDQLIDKTALGNYEPINSRMGQFRQGTKTYIAVKDNIRFEDATEEPTPTKIVYRHVCIGATNEATVNALIEKLKTIPGLEVEVINND